MRKTTTHRQRRLIDYVITVALLAAPLLLRSKRKRKRVTNEEAISRTLFNGLSKTSVSIKPAPAVDPVHKILDVANLMGFIASPKTTGFSGNRILRGFFKTILLAGCVHLLLKDHRNKDRFAALDQKTVTPA